jgi:hypothetical protein
VGIRNGDRDTTVGSARGALPYQEGLPVPYPFPQGLSW